MKNAQISERNWRADLALPCTSNAAESPTAANQVQINLPINA